MQRVTGFGRQHEKMCLDGYCIVKSQTQTYEGEL